MHGGPARGHCRDQCRCDHQPERPPRSSFRPCSPHGPSIAPTCSPVQGSRSGDITEPPHRQASTRLRCARNRTERTPLVGEVWTLTARIGARMVAARMRDLGSSPRARPGIAIVWERGIQMARRPEPCVECGEDTSAGTPLFSDRLTREHGNRTEHLCRLCAERHHPSQELHSDEEREREQARLEQAAYAYAAASARNR